MFGSVTLCLSLPASIAMRGQSQTNVSVNLIQQVGFWLCLYAYSLMGSRDYCYLTELHVHLTWFRCLFLHSFNILTQTFFYFAQWDLLHLEVSKHELHLDIQSINN